MLVGTETRMMLLTTESDRIVNRGREAPCLAVHEAGCSGTFAVDPSHGGSKK